MQRKIYIFNFLEQDSQSLQMKLYLLYDLSYYFNEIFIYLSGL